MKRGFKIKQKAFFIIFEGISFFLNGESPILIRDNRMYNGI